ncbi:Raf serine/threonine-protein kinase [Thelohanellus kitauei]|uniref:Raf serine/threonine-protein kinase n=1 Tax=Thelohanellus kitauei TaxID=669202 RepID=A0A0C2I7D6_THEKT|nr:Raf serine/threonine-protein kinase [Thelohanellus kitauei]
MGKVIGSGSFGTVYKGQYYGNVAIKVLRINKPNPEQMQAFKNEAMLLKKCDLGLATVINATTKQAVQGDSSIAGSILWMAPEVIRSRKDDTYSPKSDVYSYGIVLYEMLSHSLPYSEIKNVQIVFYRVGQNKLSPDFDKIPDQSSRIARLAKLCLSFDPDKRPSFNEISQMTTRIYITTPFISRTTSHLHAKSQEQLNVSPTYLSAINVLYREPFYLKNLKKSSSGFTAFEKAEKPE